MDIGKYINNKSMKLFKEFDKYDFQYEQAIYKLLDNNPHINDMILPVVNLIYQKIEIEIKFLIAEPHIRKETFKELGISNTHDLKSLFDREELKKYYEDIDVCEHYYNEYKDNVLYFYEIMGKQSFLNSRYPIETNKNEITLKNNIDISELYQRWTRYCLVYSKIIQIYIAYSSFNIIVYLKKLGIINDEIEEENSINQLIEEYYSDYPIDDYQEERKESYSLIKLFIKRNKYFDDSYIF